MCNTLCIGIAATATDVGEGTLEKGGVRSSEVEELLGGNHLLAARKAAGSQTRLY